MVDSRFQLNYFTKTFHGADHMQNFPKNWYFLSTDTYTYVCVTRVRNIKFSHNLAYVVNGWSRKGTLQTCFISMRCFPFQYFNIPRYCSVLTTSFGWMDIFSLMAKLKTTSYFWKRTFLENWISMPFILALSSPEDNKTKETGYNLPGTEFKRINSILFLLETLKNLGFQEEYNRINVITKIKP